MHGAWNAGWICPLAYGQLWTCIMISIKTGGLHPTVMKETPLSEPPLQTTTTSSRRPPLAASAQVIKRSNLKKSGEKGENFLDCILSKLMLTLGSAKFQINCDCQLTFGISRLLLVSNIFPAFNRRHTDAEILNSGAGAPIPTSGETQLILLTKMWFLTKMPVSWIIHSRPPRLMLLFVTKQFLNSPFKGVVNICPI